MRALHGVPPASIPVAWRQHTAPAAVATAAVCGRDKDQVCQLGLVGLHMQVQEGHRLPFTRCCCLARLFCCLFFVMCATGAA
jgi:hypothetical protein